VIPGHLARFLRRKMLPEFIQKNLMGSGHVEDIGGEE
jgi:hypothetical protein